MLSKEEHIARLIFLHIQGMTDNAQEKELNEWRSVSRGMKNFFNECCQANTWKKYFPFRENGRREGERMVATQQKARSGRSVRKIKWFPYAAAIVLILSVGGVFLFFRG